MLQTASLRVLEDRDRDRADVLDLLGCDPIQNVFVASRVHAAGLAPQRLGAELWGYSVDGRLAAVCYAGANLVPAARDRLPHRSDGRPGGSAAPAAPLPAYLSDALLAFADRARRQGRRCSSLVGPALLVARLWELLEPDWGPARDVRPNQPVLALSAPPRIAPDPLVRPVRHDELDLLVPASVAMFTEEVGVSPLASDGTALYRARVAELVQAGHAFARIEDGRVVFKAEVGAVTPYAAQVQGVWVVPDRRGEGLSRAGMAAVVEHVRRAIAPTVTLYVNDYNTPARAAYRRVGFAEVGTAMTVLF